MNRDSKIFERKRTNFASKNMPIVVLLFLGLIGKKSLLWKLIFKPDNCSKKNQLHVYDFH
jgi:hypothetical protein